MSKPKPLPWINGEPRSFDAREIGFTLDLSEECLREIREIELNQRLAAAQAPLYFFD